MCVYSYSTIVFGHTSNPLTLGAILQKHFQHYNVRVAVYLSHKLYIDNLLSGGQTEAEATAYYHRALDSMKGRFVLRQWSTNSPNLLDIIKAHGFQTKYDTNSLLSLQWNSSTDCHLFQPKVIDSSSDVLTKHTGLSIACQFSPSFSSSSSLKKHLTTKPVDTNVYTKI